MKSTVGTDRYADCLLENTSIKHNKYVVNQRFEHVDDISFREFFGRIRVVFPFLAQVHVYVSTLAILFYKPTPLICPTA
jgi:hypothetical protein